MDQPLTGTFPYYSDGKAGEKYSTGDYKATNGRLYKVSTSGAGTPLAWYPAPGFRDGGNNNRFGNLTGVGYDGFSSSSTASNTGHGSLYFNMQYFNSGSTTIRGHSLQLRCLSE